MSTGTPGSAPDPGVPDEPQHPGSEPHDGSEQHDTSAPASWAGDALRQLAASISLSGAFAALAGLVCTVIWAATGTGYYWPAWVWLAGVVVVSSEAVALRLLLLSLRVPVGRTARIGGHALVSGVIGAWLVLVWALVVPWRVFWPAWPLLGLAVVLAVHALIEYRGVLTHGGRERELAARVETLTRTRRDALDGQAVQLRRIERDLHDGAQARLVALTMQLGRAEIKLGDHPDAAALVRTAREEARAAIAELRDLARGIAPPVLADRGLVAAVQSLADRSAATVTVTAHGVDRLPPSVENAAYFVVAESLTNAAKHAPGADARVTLTRRHTALLLDVLDDGPGGADPHGSGLDGLRARVEALDGTFAVDSPPGGPTLVHAELPCGS